MIKYSPSSRTGRNSRNSRGADSLNSATTDSETDHDGTTTVGNGITTAASSLTKSPKARRHSGRKYRYSTGKKGEILLTNNKSSTFSNRISVTSTTLKSTEIVCDTDSSEDIFNLTSKRRITSVTPHNNDPLKIGIASCKFNNDDKTSGSTAAKIIIENKLLTNVIDSVHSDSEPKIRKHPSQLSLTETFLLSQHKDSGFSSCGSSHGLSPDIPQSILTSSQETYCSEIELPLLPESQSTDVCDSAAIFSSQNSTISQSADCQLITKQCSNLSEMSTISMASDLGAISTCSEHLENDSVIKLGDIASLSNLRRRSYSDTDDVPAPQPSSSCPPLSTTPLTPSKKAKLDNSSTSGSCMMCLTGPKNGVFVHSKVLHACCCYPCAVKIWNKRKQCPICNGKVKNVMKLFIH